MASPAWSARLELICNLDKPDYLFKVFFDTDEKTVTERGKTYPVILSNEKYILWVALDNESAQLNGYDIRRQRLYYREFHIGFDSLVFSESKDGLKCAYAN